MQRLSELKHLLTRQASFATQNDCPSTENALDTFMSKGNERLLLRLEEDSLLWYPEKNSAHKTRISVNEIFAVGEGSKTARCLGSVLPFLYVWTFRRNRRRPSVWKPIRLEFYHRETKTLKAWRGRIDEVMTAMRDRPRRLWVFINPFGGSKSALKIWKRRVSPLFAASGIDCQVHITSSADEAYHTIRSAESSLLLSFDGIIVVGGDGLYQEVMNGLLDRKDTAQHSLRIGHIPAGSTDAVAWSINGSRCPVSAALRIILGDRLTLDTMHVESGSEKSVRYASCLAGYGFMGDVISMSDRLRRLGPIRYDVAGVAAFLTHRKQRARISFVRAPEININGLECRSNCVHCEGIQKSNPDNASASVPENPETIEGAFVSIIIAVIPCRSDKSPNGLVPRAHLSDGRLHITLIRDCPRWCHLSFLISVAKHGIIPGKHDFVQSIDAQWVQVEPIDGTSVWSIDGEVMHDQMITSRVRQGIVEVFARGVEK